MTLNEYLRSVLKDENIMKDYVKYLISQKYSESQITIKLWNLENGIFPLLGDSENFCDLSEIDFSKYQQTNCNCGQRLTGCINNTGNCGM